jgi:hypothetical protein
MMLMTARPDEPKLSPISFTMRMSMASSLRMMLAVWGARTGAYREVTDQVTVSEIVDVLRHAREGGINLQQS